MLYLRYGPKSIGAQKKIIFAKVLQETSQRRWVSRDAKNFSAVQGRERTFLAERVVVEQWGVKVKG